MAITCSYRIKAGYQTIKVGEVTRSFENTDDWITHHLGRLNNQKLVRGFDEQASPAFELLAHDESIHFEAMSLEDDSHELLIDFEDGGQSKQQYELIAYVTIMHAGDES